MTTPLQLVQVFNETMGTKLTAIPKFETLQTASGLDNKLCLLETEAFQIYGCPEDQALMNLFQTLLTLQPDVNPKPYQDQPWFTYLEGTTDTLPQKPARQIDKTYRLCRIEGIEPQIRGELAQLSGELLQAELLFDADHMLLQLEDLTSLPEALCAFYETFAVEFGQHLLILLSARLTSDSDLRDGYKTLEALKQAALTSAIQGPVFFETHMAQLLIDEWLSHDQGPVFRSVQNLGATAALDDEALRTIDMLFKMNLNLTDTAKALFIHRNTLIYRLEKIQKSLGFDLRSFEDCFMMKLLLHV